MPPSTRLPRFAAAFLGLFVPDAERDEVVSDLAEEYGGRQARDGGVAAGLWLSRQVLGSVPSLLRRSWWRGWTGFEPRASGLRSGGFSMESWIMDLRYAGRRLRSRPTYALLAVLTLALGVGGTAAIFSIVRGLLIEPLPYRAESEIGVFYFDGSWNEQEFLGLRPDFPGFQLVAAHRPDDVTLEIPDAPTRLLAGIASSAELFNVLGTSPVVGRGFQPGDDLAGAEPVAVLSYGLWQELGGDRSVIGQPIRLDGVERTVVGIMPKGFWYPNPSVKVWFPAPMNPANRAGRYTLVGRVAPGVTLANIEPSLAQLTKILGERYTYSPQWDKTKDAAVTPVREYLTGSLRPALLATLTAMGVILLIACANVAALMLGQVDGRSAELAVRSALGADRRRLTQQLVAEALVVGVLAAITGALLATLGFKVLVGALPLGEWGANAAVDWTLFLAAIGLAIVAALLIAIIPAVALWRGDLRGALTRVRTSAGGGRGGRMEGGLVVAEVALAVLMAAGAGLLIRSVTKLYAIDPGVATEGVALVDVALGADLTGPIRRQRIRDITAELGAMPGVETAAAAQKIPLRGAGDNWGMAVEGQPELEQSTTAFRMVTPGYLEAMGMPLRDGRTFTEADRASAEPVVVVNQALVDKYFPGVPALGRNVSNGTGGWARVIGIVGNASEAKLTDDPVPARYILADHVSYTGEGQTFVIRTVRPGDATSILETARNTIRRVAPDVAIREATTMEHVFANAVGPARQIMTLLAILTGLALVLGAIGVYGVISHFVHRRRRDYGIRIALGLTPSKVIGQVVGRGAALVAIGVVIGIVAALASAKLLASLLYGVEATDPVALAGATAVLMLAGVLAAYIPAFRASRLDPATTLREQ